MIPRAERILYEDPHRPAMWPKGRQTWRYQHGFRFRWAGWNLEFPLGEPWYESFDREGINRYVPWDEAA